MWTVDSWQRATIAQDVQYDDNEDLHRVLARLHTLPPLISPHEITKLQAELSEAQEGRSFVLQAGDCAERFKDCTPEIIVKQVCTLMRMQSVLAHDLKLPIVCIGRIAGQYAKPRSEPFESRDGITLPSFRGDIINSLEFSSEARRYDPARLFEAYAHSAFTLNMVRNLLDEGLPDIDKPDTWNLAGMENDYNTKGYHHFASRALDSARPASAFSINKHRNYGLCYTSHEALHLHYEQALTRAMPDDKWTNLGTHFPWLGLRTGMPEGAHMEYLRGISNPIAVKVGPNTTAAQLLYTIDILNPSNSSGKLCLITRMGKSHIARKLPPLLDAIKREGRHVLWMVDPMHGNTENTASGYKTRQFNRICSEIEIAIDLHQTAGTRLGGVHLEISGEDVTECLGGAIGLCESDLPSYYRSAVDPRLNASQAVEMAFFLASRMRQETR
ncbi:3-deoxy-7-phosphoheptulonate synthase [Sodalis ligni]|uniref:3-deoxy-7-phosphoheptulonate synthase n=1 Tax=Sodalis ligni TaxID=2697027 RepID=UPI001BDF2FF9|nr:3-deoxy-7-phosphoheptulonate synthase class II [Sodalis ligni]QWA09124.1 3-deoxy-7-phosphoheptulonate synthase [Sodalis ligni]